MPRFHNIIGSTSVTVELIAPTEDNNNIKSILLTNVHATADATVTLFIQDDPASGTTSTYNIISTIAIPSSRKIAANGQAIAWGISDDLIDRGYGNGGLDFLKSTNKKAESLVTNPPYSLSVPFWEKCEELKIKKYLSRIIL